MRVAFYGRFSSDKQKDSSIDQQYRNCQRFADREGWAIMKRYEDRGISGTEGEEGRPGYKQMLADAKAKAFDVLLVDDFSRLSRDKRESEQTRRRMVFHGIRLIGVSDGIDTSQKAHKIQAMAKDMVNDIFIDDLREKIKRGMVEQAAQGFWNGSRVYGYKLVAVHHETKVNQFGEPLRIGTKLEIDPEQARWVRQIFTWYAEGWGALKIVTELNRLNVPSPGSFYKPSSSKGTPSWNFLAIHGEPQKGTGILNRHLYRGLYRWNRRRRVIDPDSGKTFTRWKDQSEWIEHSLPHLRIISESCGTRSRSGAWR